MYDREPIAGCLSFLYRNSKKIVPAAPDHNGGEQKWRFVWKIVLLLQRKMF